MATGRQGSRYVKFSQANDDNTGRVLAAISEKKSRIAKAGDFSPKDRVRLPDDRIGTVASVDLVLGAVMVRPPMGRLTSYSPFAITKL